VIITFNEKLPGYLVSKGERQWGCSNAAFKYMIHSRPPQVKE